MEEQKSISNFLIESAFFFFQLKDFKYLSNKVASCNDGDELWTAPYSIAHAKHKVDIMLESWDLTSDLGWNYNGSVGRRDGLCNHFV